MNPGEHPGEREYYRDLAKLNKAYERGLMTLDEYREKLDALSKTWRDRMKVVHVEAVRLPY